MSTQKSDKPNQVRSQKATQKQTEAADQSGDDQLEIKVEKTEQQVIDFDNNESTSSDRTAGPDPIKQENQPYARDQVSASGHMPDPDVDNNALDMAQRTGLYTQAKPGEPEKLGVAEQVKQAEQERRQK